MNNLYIVESPLQALCALEVSLGKKNETHAVIVRVSSGTRARSDKQILDIINKREWDFKSVVKYSFHKIPFANQIESKVSLLNIEKKFKGKVFSLYIGEFRSFFMHMVRVAVKAPNVFLLDDGAVSVKIVNKYINKGYYYPYDSFYPTYYHSLPFANQLKESVFKLIYKRYLDFSIMSKNIKMVTAFSSCESNNIERLTFSNIKNLIKEKKSTDDSVVYYYGSKYSEVGIISCEYELLFLKDIKDFYDKKDKRVVYFAHRDESEEKLNYFSKELGFEVIIPDIMAELYLLESKVLPSEISGAYTSILNNVKVIFPEVSLRSFRLKPEQIGQKWRKDIELVYDYYKVLDIPIED